MADEYAQMHVHWFDEGAKYVKFLKKLVVKYSENQKRMGRAATKSNVPILGIGSEIHGLYKPMHLIFCLFP